MKKKLLIVCLLSLSVFAFSACGSKTSGKKDGKVALKGESESTSSENVNKDLENLDYEEINKAISFSSEIKDDPSTEELEAYVTVKNNSSEKIYDIVMDITFLDANKKELGDGNYGAEFMLDIGKEAVFLVTTDSDVDAKSVASISIKEYNYLTDKNVYLVDVLNKEVDGYVDDTSNVEFDKANIVDIQSSTGKLDEGDYIYDVVLSNKSNKKIKEVMTYYSMYDKNGTYIGEGGSISENALDANGKITTEGYSDTVGNITDIASHDIYMYTYELEEKDENGYNYYEVNLKRKIAQGRVKD